MTAEHDAARRWLTDHPGQLTPHRVAQALRESGCLVGDAVVLAVYEDLRAEQRAEERSSESQIRWMETDLMHGRLAGLARSDGLNADQRIGVCMAEKILAERSRELRARCDSEAGQ